MAKSSNILSAARFSAVLLIGGLVLSAASAEPAAAWGFDLGFGSGDKAVQQNADDQLSPQVEETLKNLRPPARSRDVDGAKARLDHLAKVLVATTERINRLQLQNAQLLKQLPAGSESAMEVAKTGLQAMVEAAKFEREQLLQAQERASLDLDLLKISGGLYRNSSLTDATELLFGLRNELNRLGVQEKQIVASLSNKPLWVVAAASKTPLASIAGTGAAERKSAETKSAETKSEERSIAKTKVEAPVAALEPERSNAEPVKPEKVPSPDVPKVAQPTPSVEKAKDAGRDATPAPLELRSSSLPGFVDGVPNAKIFFDRPHVSFAPELKRFMASPQAKEKQASIRVVGIAPYRVDERDQTLGMQASAQYAGAVVRKLISMGVDATRIDRATSTSAEAFGPEVHLYWQPGN